MRLDLNVSRKYAFWILFSVFIFYSFAIVYLHLVYPDNDSELFNYYTDSYGVIAMLGGLLGLSFYRRWGGFNSVVGRSLIFLSIGLAFQFLGQISYAFFRYAYNVEIAYPSFGEIFYFGSIPLYILGTWLISVAAGIKVKLRNPTSKVLSILFITLVAIVSVSISFKLFADSYDFSNPDFVVILLEIGYPLGQAISVSLAILAFILSKDILGGKMKEKVILILIALILQYIADVYYTYDIYNETFYSGGLSDYLYILAYFVMGVSLFNLGTIPEKIAESNLKMGKNESK